MKIKRETVLGLAFALFAMLPELAYWIGYQMSGKIPTQGSCGILVFGFPTQQDGSPHPIQRIRMELAVEAFKENRCSKMVVSGGSPHSGYIEAETMSQLAIDQGIGKDRLILEKRARSTLENILFTSPHLEDMDRIILVSDGLHVHRAKRYLCRNRPDLCPKTYCYTRHRPFQLYGFKCLGAINELRVFIQDHLQQSH